MAVNIGFDPVSAVLGAVQLGNDIWRQNYEVNADERNFAYQKELQQQMLAREDNALQRQMADAQAAGLNPFSVAGGSGAGAGSVVSKNSTPSLPSLGSVLDHYAAVRRMPYEMKELQAGVRQAEAQADIADSNAHAQEYQNMINNANVLMSLGVPAYVGNRDGEIGLYVDQNSPAVPLGDTPFGINYKALNSINVSKSTELEKMLQYYDQSAVSGMIMPLLKLLLDNM